jgi:hypothetical protein
MDGATLYAFQVKGGRNNIVRDCLVKNVNSAGSVTVSTGFRDRGDQPWDASATGTLSPVPTYPWDTLSWSDADTRRASINTRYINCRVEDSDVAAFVGQEGYGATWENCSYYNVGHGWVLSRMDDAQSDERDYTIINPEGDITAAGYGIAINGVSSYHLPNVKVIGGTINTSYLTGLRTTYADDLLIDGLTVYNSGQANSGTYYGIGVITSSLRPTIINSKAIDNQGSATQDYGIYVDTTCYQPILKNNRASGNGTGQIVAWLPGMYGDNIPAEGVGQTTDATPTSTFWRMTMADGDMVWVEVTIIGDQSDHSNRAVYKIGGLYSCASGTASLQGSLADLITAIESDAAWAATLTTSTNTVRASVTGKAGTTINWRIFATIKPLI